MNQQIPLSIPKQNEIELAAMRENFKALRLAKGWTIEDLAKLSGIDAKILAAIEGGQDFEVHYLIQLCRVYRVKPHEIFTRVEII